MLAVFVDFFLFHRTNLRSSKFFVMQERRGHGDNSSFLSKVIGTLDNVLDTKAQPFRILLQTPHSELSYLLAKANTEPDIVDHWDYVQVSPRLLLRFLWLSMLSPSFFLFPAFVSTFAGVSGDGS